MGPKALVHDWQTFGTMFENLCIRDLLVYAQALPDIGFEPIRYYRDDSGLEADAIIELADGRWAAFEIKVSEEGVPARIPRPTRGPVPSPKTPFEARPSDGRPQSVRENGPMEYSAHE